MLVWNDTVSIGDCIVSFPGTLEFARRLGDVEIYWTNAACGDLFPHEKYGIGRAKWHYSKKPIQLISIHNMVWDMILNGTRYKGQHPSSMFLSYLGIPTEAPIKPEIVIPEIGTNCQTYDLIIAPYILADINRMWPLERWEAVIKAVRSTHPDLKIAVIGGKKLPSDDDLRKIAPYGTDHFYISQRTQFQHKIPDVDYLFDRPLSEVAFLLSRAAAVFTVDSGPARMMQGIGGKHLLLCHNTVNKEWGSYPEATTIYADMATLQPDEVIPTALNLLN